MNIGPNQYITKLWLYVGQNPLKLPPLLAPNHVVRGDLLNLYLDPFLVLPIALPLNKVIHPLPVMRALRVSQVRDSGNRCRHRGQEVLYRGPEMTFCEAEVRRRGARYPLGERERK